jgi:hypothetical protein
VSETTVDPDDVATVGKLLGLAGLPASDHEIEVMASSYHITRRQIAALWAMPEARYADPALVFSADPPVGSWP